MDKLTQHIEITREVMQEILALDTESQLIIDEKNRQFLLFTNEWVDLKREYGCYLHIEVKENAQIYIQHNGTNLLIADEFLKKGVLKENIVLAFQAPYKRAYSGFAEA